MNRGTEKAQRRLSEYVEAVAEGNRVATRNALRALLDECSEEDGIFVQLMVEVRLGITYHELLEMDKRGELSLSKDKPPSIPPRKSDAACST
jgi:hypothetical protein